MSKKLIVLLTIVTVLIISVSIVGARIQTKSMSETRSMKWSKMSQFIRLKALNL